MMHTIVKAASITTLVVTIHVNSTTSMSSTYKSTKTNIKFSQLVMTSTGIHKYFDPIQSKFSVRRNRCKQFFANFSSNSSNTIKINQASDSCIILYKFNYQQNMQNPIINLSICSNQKLHTNFGLAKRKKIKPVFWGLTYLGTEYIHSQKAQTSATEPQQHLQAAENPQVCPLTSML